MPLPQGLCTGCFPSLPAASLASFRAGSNPPPGAAFLVRSLPLPFSPLPTLTRFPLHITLPGSQSSWPRFHSLEGRLQLPIRSAAPRKQAGAASLYPWSPPGRAGCLQSECANPARPCPAGPRLLGHRVEKELGPGLVPTPAQSLAGHTPSEARGILLTGAAPHAAPPLTTENLAATKCSRSPCSGPSRPGHASRCPSAAH